MATTKTKKNTEVEAKKTTKTHPLIISPRITEKAAKSVEKGAYTFNVATNATKNEIKKAIKALYGVTPVRVGMTKITEKVVFVRGKMGVKKGGKKAVVYLKKGDKIEFV